jgi:hypothetical protein
MLKPVKEGYNMNIRNNIIALDPPIKKKETKRSTRKFIHSLEYEVIANLVLQQFEKDGEIRFDLLWAIPATDRIPALRIEYGKSRMYKLLMTLLKEFCISIPLPKTKKLNETRINVCACDLMIFAEEQALSIEDFIIFFERTKRGSYGPVKKHLTHQLIKEKFEIYLTERNSVFAKLSEQKHLELKAVGPKERVCREPRQIGELLNHQAAVIEMNKKMSG